MDVSMKIRLIGQRNNLGIGVHYSNFADALRRIQPWGNRVEEIDCTDMNALMRAAGQSQDQDINICFVSMPLQNHYRGTNIQWIVFESDRIPSIVLPTLQTADQVWVPSQWGYQILMQHGLDPDRCSIVQEGVDTELYHTWRPRVERDQVRFLTVGKYEQRKSITETIEAWAQAFGADPDVYLTVKTDHFVDQDIKQQQIRDQLESLALSNVTVLWGSADRDLMINLYRDADVFVLPTKGEGWGLPLIEAAASGLPVITTEWGAHTQFLKSSSCIFVEHDLVPIQCPEYQRFYPQAGDWGQWAQPRIDSIAQALITARDQIPQLRQQAQINARQIRQEFSWSQCAARALDVLHHQGLLNIPVDQ
jgi:glycosyltransferase involved in cell wall biosynthesis